MKKDLFFELLMYAICVILVAAQLSLRRPYPLSMTKIM
jgi:hypothetical protein